MRLQQQASRCGFNDQLNNQLRDRIVAGINNQEVEKKLLVPDLTIKIAQEILLAHDNLTQAVGSDNVLFTNKKKII